MRLVHELSNTHSACRYLWFGGRCPWFYVRSLDNPEALGPRDLLEKQLVHRETLYADFISESARLLVDALQHNLNDPKNLIPVYALLGRIRLSSSSQVLTAAEVVVRAIIETYQKPNLNAEQIEAGP